MNNRTAHPANSAHARFSVPRDLKKRMKQLASCEGYDGAEDMPDVLSYGVGSRCGKESASVFVAKLMEEHPERYGGRLAPLILDAAGKMIVGGDVVENFRRGWIVGLLYNLELILYEAAITAMAQADVFCDVAPDGKRRDGAKACMDSLHQLIDDAAIPCGDDAADYFVKRHEDAKAFATRLGPLPPRIGGMLIALAEYIHSEETTGTPNLDVWLPWCAKSNTERAADLAQMQTDFDENREVSNVVFWPGRGNVPAVSPSAL